MFVFVTYGRSDMRGVQVRGIRAASLLPKNKVLFINQGDDTWIRQHNFRCLNLKSSGIYLPNQIKLPKNTKKIIFADLPTDRFFQLSILFAAKERKIPVVVLDNFYSKKQFKEKIWQRTIAFCDFLVLNGPKNLAPKNLPSHIKIVSPLLAKPKSKAETWKNLAKFGLNESTPYILSSGYNPNVLKNIKILAKKLFKILPKLKIVVIGAPTKKTEKNILYLPPVGEEKVRELLSCALGFVGKMGYLQVLEALAFAIPVFAVGRDQGFKISWIEPKMKKAIFYYPKVNQKLIHHIYKFITNQKEREKIKNLINTFGLSDFDGIEQTTKFIKTAKLRNKNIKKIVFLACEDNQEKISKALKKILQKNIFVLPLIFSLNPKPHPEALPPSKEFIRSYFYSLLRFSPDSVHGAGQIFPWYNDIIKNIHHLTKRADKIILFGKRAKEIFQPLLNLKNY